MDFLMDSLWGGSVAPSVAAPLAAAPVSSLASVTEPSWFNTIGSAIASPFVTTGKGIIEGLPMFANTAAQSLNNMLIQKYLLPQPKNQGNGQTIVYTDRPNQGTTPPSVVVVPGGGSSGSGQGGSWLPNFLGGSGSKETSVAFVMVGILILLAVFLMKR